MLFCGCCSGCQRWSLAVLSGWLRFLEHNIASLFLVSYHMLMRQLLNNGSCWCGFGCWLRPRRLSGRHRRFLLPFLLLLVVLRRTAYRWPSMLQSARSFTGIVFFCVVVTLLDLNVFFLKSELYLHSSHPIIIARLTLFSLAAAAGTREFYAYLTDK